MLRCSTLILTTAVCLCCTPVLLGQTQARAGYASQEAAQGSNEGQIRQRPWLENSASRGKYSGALSTDSGAAKSNGNSDQYRMAANGDPFNEEAFYAARKRSEAATRSKQDPNQIDPLVRREIEERVRRDLEREFESRIQSMVKKQVRAQVRQAEQKLERAARSNRVTSRPMSASVYRSANLKKKPPTVPGEVFPLNGSEPLEEPRIEHTHSRYVVSDSRFRSTYRPPRKRERQKAEPRLTTEQQQAQQQQAQQQQVQQQQIQQQQQVQQRQAQPSAQPEALSRNQRETQRALGYVQDEAYSKPQSVLKTDQPILSSTTDSMAQTTATRATTMNVPATQIAYAQPKTTPRETTPPVAAVQQTSPPAVSYLLRTSVIGPEALLKDQSDSFEITVANVSQQPATNVIVQLTVPQEITISKLDRDAYLDAKSRTVSWKIPSIGPEQKEVIRYRAVSSAAGRYEQQVTLGMENTFQGRTPFTTVVQVGAPQIPLDVNNQNTVEVAERLQFDQ